MVLNFWLVNIPQDPNVDHLDLLPVIVFPVWTVVGVIGVVCIMIDTDTTPHADKVSAGVPILLAFHMNQVFDFAMGFYLLLNSIEDISDHCTKLDR